MGNMDKWTTPKQIKIERAGEPRGIKRGKLKKGERRKGKKARIDEILSARNDAKRYAEYVTSDRKRRIEHPEWYIPTEGCYKRYDPHYMEWFKTALEKLKKIVAKCIKDGIITEEESEQYEVIL